MGHIAPPAHIKEKLEELEGINCVITVEKATYKTLSQNSAFHALISCFWRSGCSSFSSKEQMRSHYIIEADHISFIKYIWFDDEGNAFETTDESNIPPNYNYAEILFPASWSNISKEKAMQVMTSLMRDMDESGVLASSEGMKYAEILDGMTKEDWFTKALKG